MYPLPAEILPGPWTIHDSNAPHVSLSERQLYINLDDDPQWANVRAHELGHIKWTPVDAEQPPDIPNFILQAVEDMRINTLLRRSGVDLSAGGPEHIVQGVMMACGKDFRPLSLLIMADLKACDMVSAQAAKYLPQPTEGMSLEDTQTLKRLYERVRALVTRAQDLMYAHRCDASLIAGHCITSAPLTFDRTLDVARDLMRAFEKMLREDKGEAEATASADASRKSQLGDPQEGTPDKPFRKEDASVYNKGLSTKWGKLYIEYPSLLATKKTGRAVRISDEGSALRAPWRVTTDHRVFRAINKAKRTGTILIDGSGSMCVSAEMAEAFTLAIPASTVAAYHGLVHEDASGCHMDHGILRILAKNGRVATAPQAFKFGGGNVVDGPALEWLARQPRPRLWVCDGWVSGKEDRSSTLLRQEANALMRRYHILRFQDFEDALAYVKHGASQVTPKTSVAGYY